MEVRESSAHYLVKSGFKQTEVGVIPEDWEVCTLEDVTDPKRPISYGIVQTGPSVQNGVPCLRVVDIDDGRIKNADLITTSQTISNAYRRTILQSGDLVMPLRGKVGDVALIGDELAGCNLTRGVAVIAVLRDRNALYCKHFIASPATRIRLAQSMNGSALQEIPIAPLRAFEIALPSTFAEQQAIAEALSDADALIEAQEHLLAKKRQIKQGAMQELLTGQKRLPGFAGKWDASLLGSVIDSLVAGVSVNSVEGEPSIGTPCVLKTSALSKGQFFASECKTIARNDWRRAQTTPRTNSILISRMNTPDLVGEVGYVANDYPWLFLPDRIWMTQFRADSQIDVRWLCYLLSNTEYRQKIKDTATGTSGSMKNVSKGALLSLPIFFPSHEEQTAIATVLSDLDAELAALETKLAKARQLKQGMMQELLTGRIRLV